MTSCTHSSQTKDNEKAKAAWRRYHQAYDAKNLNRALAVIDSMKTETRSLIKAMPQTLRKIGIPIPMRATVGHVCAFAGATLREHSASSPNC